jgi:hypothetical protein
MRKPASKNVRKEEPKRPRGLAAGIEECPRPELTHAARTAHRHTADRHPPTQIAARSRLFCQTSLADKLAQPPGSFSNQILSQRERPEGYAVGAWGNLCKAELPVEGEKPLTTKSLSANPV